MGKDNKNSQGPESQKKILMIDDSDSALEIMELYVESEFDNPIITATNGNEAIDILKKINQIFILNIGLNPIFS